jgi:hypothetical protein
MRKLNILKHDMSLISTTFSFSQYYSGWLVPLVDERNDKRYIYTDNARGPLL